MSNGVKGGGRSAVIEFAVVTSLAITVASLVKSKSYAFLFGSSCSTLRFFNSTAWLIIVLIFLVVNF